MQVIDDPRQRRIVSIPTLTAWLSVCILAAAWGKSLNENWQQIWADVGAFGLVASVGLSLIERARIAHRRRARERALQSRAEFGLAKLNEQGAALDAINAAIRRLQAAAARYSDCESSSGGEAGENEAMEPLSRLPMEITPVVDYDDANCELAEPIAGSLRKISARGVAFWHARPFVSRVAVLTFRFGDGQCLSFVVDVLWTEATPEGFVTNGAVLDVGVPAPGESPDESPDEAPATPEACPV